jgi:signal transduction histidine kinase
LRLNLFPNRFLTRLQDHADIGEKLRLERVIATARAFLATSALFAIYVDPSRPARYAPIAYAVIAGYLLYSLLVWWLIGVRPQWFRHGLPIHAVDVLIPAVFTFFTQGPNSPFFIFFVFVTATAAVRWGFPETVFTGIVVLLLMLLQAAVLSGPLSTVFDVEGAYDLNRLLIRTAFMLVVSILLGYLAEQQKELSAEEGVFGRLLAAIRPENGMRAAVQQLLSELLRIFRAPRAAAIIQQQDTGRVFLWNVRARSDGAAADVDVKEADPDRRDEYIFPCKVHSFHTERHSHGWDVWGLDASGKSVGSQGCEPELVPGAAQVRSITCLSFHMGEQWTGRVVIYDGSMGRERRKELSFAQRLLEHAGPAVYTVYLLRRLRSRAGAIERARFARELHDGTIQALISVEMQVDVLRRQAQKSAADSRFSDQLAHVQGLLKEQVLELRSLMQAMRPVELSPHQLLDYLANLVDRFRRDTGLAVQFTTDLDDVDLSPRVCREIIRIVQEALVNIRKHSGATQALVRFGVQSGQWRLVVEDNGRGFDFVGRLSLKDLDDAHKGPVIIKERVRTIGGDLNIESLPSRGASLEITFPQKANLAFA